MSKTAKPMCWKPTATCAASSYWWRKRASCCSTTWPWHLTRTARGYGRKLVDFAEAYTRRRGFGAIKLYTHVKMTENVGIYTKLGYRETHRATEKGFERVYMRKDLKAD